MIEVPFLFVHFNEIRAGDRGHNEHGQGGLSSFACVFRSPPSMYQNKRTKKRKKCTMDPCHDRCNHVITPCDVQYPATTCLNVLDRAQEFNASAVH